MKKWLSITLAAVMLCGVITGCGGKKAAINMEDPDKVPEDTYEIQWYLMADAQNDVGTVEAALNEYLKDKINATVKINCLPSAQYKQKVGTMINANEYFDLCFVARWMLDYIDNSRSGAFFDLTDYTDTYLKDIKDEMGEENLSYSKVDGRLYALPVYKEMATQYGWIYRKDIADKYSIDMTKYKSFEELEPVLEMIKEKEAGMSYPIDWTTDATPSTLYQMEEYFISKDGKFDDTKAINYYETEEFKKACETAREFYNKGLVRPDVLTATDQVSRMSEGKTFVMLQPIKPGKADEMFQSSIYKFEQAAVTEPIIDYLAGTGAMQAVSASSKNPARVMRFLNLLNTDSYVKNLIIHGVEAKHYNRVSDTVIEPIENSGYDLHSVSWAIGNVFLDDTLTSEDADKNAKLKAFNDAASVAKVCAFMPAKPDAETRRRRTELDNAISNFKKQLVVGAVEIEPTLTNFKNTLVKCGVNEHMKMVQEQYDEYLKTLK